MLHTEKGLWIQEPPLNSKMLAQMDETLNPTEIRVLNCVMVYYSNTIISADKCGL